VPRPPFTFRGQAALDASRAALPAEHGSELSSMRPSRLRKIDHPLVIGSPYALRSEGSRPTLTLPFEDVSYDTCNVHIPARKREYYDPRRNYGGAQAGRSPAARLTSNSVSCHEMDLAGIWRSARIPGTWPLAPAAPPHVSGCLI
jgi:hypothetical protein